ncbi:Gfo/Idh/MocA family protein [Agrobacterium rosae]|uniref:Oxidoreductase n=1 Tax=Agrobacterium rosae TaxID=1972867 RepID=A0AAE5RU25_9HYPH|nr:Gfo/Idh/MocA family oxidoreductase [Agrobacterium rosae]KAA3511678.1 gfo/Idh/MocA family oxidoreductase [Agrobacterium rosae]KAA3518901.1 gfo/Idh/MocA family oxidoreductase [Agrobacterium rosae]MBN7806720.1 Gfo/Idh/MocA family oxidoreductase [Agrobacterium rosae]MCM2435138.1 Gfo/Idh/MocA family oxidoreductase [Agrobacterium rosae]MDX8304106.1 Gfo/Idh/MocA family oxidoreductase [Agrobacterium rosae]
MKSVRFATIGINHNHIFGQTNCLLNAGAELVGFHAIEDDLANEYAEAFSGVERIDDKRRLLDDPSIDLIITAAIPDERAPLAIEAMRAGKDVMTDKPGMVTFAQLEEVKKVQAETGRIFSVLYSEHFENRATVKAGELIAAGAIGKVVSTAGFGPHRLRASTRPDWFFERARYGGILVDIASHQCEQFLFFTNSDKADILSAKVSNRGNPQLPGLQDSGDIHLCTKDADGFIRVDWFTPDGLPSWGDGRLFITGTEGAIEIRKNVDIAGRDGGNHLFLTDKKGVQHIDCADVALRYGPQLLSDIRNRTETAMPQARCFAAMEIALKAQQIAEGRQHD